MENNIIKLALNESENGMTKQECVRLLINSRRAVRNLLQYIGDIVESNRGSRRLIRKYRESGNPVLIRNAEVIEAKVAGQNEELGAWRSGIVSIGFFLRISADDIDRLIPVREMFDILEVNPVDRAKAGSADGFMKIVFIHGLEDSATHRDSDFKEGPLFHALSRYMMDAIEANPDLQQTVNDGLFGKGGMFEFVPTFSRNARGEFVRNPPNLRLAGV